MLAKTMLSIVGLGVVGLLTYAIFSDLPAPSRTIEMPVTAK